MALSITAGVVPAPSGIRTIIAHYRSIDVEMVLVVNPTLFKTVPSFKVPFVENDFLVIARLGAFDALGKPLATSRKPSVIDYS